MMQEGAGDCIYPLIAEGVPTDTCGEPTCVATHGHTAVWVPHRCSRSQCPTCADDGYTTQQASKTLKTIQQRVLGRCSQPDHGMHNGRTLKAYKVIYSPAKDRSYGGDKAAQDRDKRTMYKNLRHLGAEYGFMIGHPYRGQHDQHDTPEQIRACMDRTKESWHYHGIVLAHWTEPAPEGAEYIVAWECIGSFEKTVKLDVMWAKIHKALTYAISHAAHTRQIVCRFGSLPGGKGEPRPDAVPMWRDPATGDTLPLKLSVLDPDVVDVKREITREIWSRHERGEPINGPVDTAEGGTFELYSYALVRVEPDDTAGLEWDVYLMAKLPKTYS